MAANLVDGASGPDGQYPPDIQYLVHHATSPVTNSMTTEAEKQLRNWVVLSKLYMPRLGSTYVHSGTFSR